MPTYMASINSQRTGPSTLPRLYLFPEFTAFSGEADRRCALQRFWLALSPYRYKRSQNLFHMQEANHCCIT